MNQLVHGTPFQKKSQQQTSYHQQSVFWVRVWLCAWWQTSLISSHLKLLSARIRVANPSLTASFFCWERCCCWPRALHPSLSFVVNGNVHVFHCISPFNHIRLVSQLQGGRRSKKKRCLVLSRAYIYDEKELVCVWNFLQMIASSGLMCDFVEFVS